MSVARETIAPALPVAATWRASSYEWGLDEGGEPQFIEASPNASWSRVDVFEKFTPSAGETQMTRDRGPHVWFMGLNQGLTNLHAARIEKEKFDEVLLWFVNRYGLLGLFNEYFAAPILPSRAGELASRVLPDALLDQRGRLHAVKPATEGKEHLEAFLHRQHGPLHTGENLTLGPQYAVLPDELSFLSRRVFTPFGVIDPPWEASHFATYLWEEVRDLFGIRAVLDEQANSGVSIISTREPIVYWTPEIENFPVPPCTAGDFNSRTWSVQPHAIPDEGGKLRPSWRCPSLLQAMYLMLYLDETGDEFEIKKCQAPNCPYYFRVRADDGRSLNSKYCPPPPDRKQSKCATRASTAMYEERQRAES